MKTLAGALTALGLIVTPAIADTNEPLTRAESQAADASPLITAKVNGMVCDFCARAVTKVFSKRDEVASVDVDLDGGFIKVGLNDGLTLDDETVETLIRKSGYSLVEIERTGGA